MKIRNVFTLCSVVAWFGGTNAYAQVAVNNRGEMIIVSSDDTPAIYRTETIEWICDEPVEITVTETLREDGTFEVARVSIKIAKFNASQEIIDEVARYANFPLFDISPKCGMAGPLAFIAFAESTADNGDGTGIANINTHPVYLKPAEPLNAD